MKKNLLLTLVALLCVVHTQAHDFEKEGIYYTITSETTVEVAKEQYSGTIIIPAEVHNYGITYSVTSIGSSAFYGCTGLTSVTIPNSVTSIGMDAFYNTPWYDNQPDEVVYINNVLYTYKGTMPYNTSIAVREGTVSISPDAFKGCTGLTSVTIPNSVTSIGNNAFSGCTGLTSITISNSVTSIESESFLGCTGLTSITIPHGVTSIGEFAFYGCRGLTSITIPNSVTSIGKSAFSGCTGLTSITIPNSVTWIGSSAFSGCTGLTSIIVESGNMKYDSRNNCNAIIETATNTLIQGCKMTIIPNSVMSIGERAFGNCTGLTSITIPNSVTSIGCSAFEFCTALTSITIPNSVTSIGSSAFNNVPNIVYYGTATGSPWGARSINGYVDGYLVYEDATKTKLLVCSTAATGEITIPNSVMSIGEGAFRGCTGLTSIVVESGNTMYDSRNNCNAIIETATNTLIQGCKTTIIPNSVTSIGRFAFSRCTGLTSVTIPNSVTSIGSDAFSYCTGLTSVTIPNSVTSIGGEAFSRCTGLTSITIPNSVTSIGESAFYGCTGLTSVTISNSVTSIGDNAFSYCTGLTSVTIPNSVTSIGNYAFFRCTGLISITIPNSVTSIGYLAFRGCTGLTSITSLAPIPPTTSKDAFMYVLTDIPVYVPCGSREAYSMAEEWKSFTNYIEQLTAIVAITSQDENKGIITITKQASCEDNECTFVATAKEDYRFVQWSDGNTDNPRTIIVTEDITLTAEFEDTSATNVLQTADNQFTIPQKIIRDGQVYILRNGKTYTTTGVEVK